MKKIKVFSLVLLGAIFGLTSCDLPDFLYKIPGVSNLLPAKEEKKEEKNSEEGKPSEDGQKTDDGTKPSGDGTKPSGDDTTPTETTKEVSFTLKSADSVSSSGVTVEFAKGQGTNAPAWYDNGLRLYAKNTLTLTSQTNMKKIEFDWEKQGSKAFAQATASTGSYSHPSAAGKGTWTGSTKSVVFTLGSEGQLQLNTFKVTIVDDGNLPEDTTGGDDDVVHTAAQIASDINANLAADGYDLELTYYNETEFTGYYLGISLEESTDDSEENLSTAAYTLASYLPEYISMTFSGYFEEDGDDPAEYDMYFENEDGSVCIDIFGYLEDGDLCAEIQVYDAEAE